jgi:hypothetical protein
MSQILATELPTPNLGHLYHAIEPTAQAERNSYSSYFSFIVSLFEEYISINKGEEVIP